MKFTYSGTDATTDVPVGTVQALTFMDDGDVFLMYTAGDCDVFLPYNLLSRCEHPDFWDFLPPARAAEMRAKCDRAEAELPTE
jgi:hypothetical protein